MGLCSGPKGTAVLADCNASVVKCECGIFACTHTYTHTHSCIHSCTHTHIHTHAYTHARTHTHTHTQALRLRFQPPLLESSIPSRPSSRSRFLLWQSCPPLTTPELRPGRCAAGSCGRGEERR